MSKQTLVSRVESLESSVIRLNERINEIEGVLNTDTFEDFSDVIGHLKDAKDEIQALRQLVGIPKEDLDWTVDRILEERYDL